MHSLLLVFKANWLKHLNASAVCLEWERGWLQSSTRCQEKEGRKRTPPGVQCIIPVNVLMYVWDWSKGKIPSETKVRKEGEMVMFIFICPLLGEMNALPLTELINNKWPHSLNWPLCDYVRWWICLKTTWPCLKHHHCAVSLTIA